MVLLYSMEIIPEMVFVSPLSQVDVIPTPFVFQSARENTHYY